MEEREDKEKEKESHISTTKELYQILTLHTLNLHYVCQLYLNKAWKEKYCRE